jgi:hypothetical protein
MKYTRKSAKDLKQYQWLSDFYNITPTKGWTQNGEYLSTYAFATHGWQSGQDKLVQSLLQTT